MVGAPQGAAVMSVGRARSTLRVATTLVVALAAAAARGEPLDVSVGCRDGAPNGGYELRDANGQLRVVGALAKGHRTGTFVFWNATGARIGVIPYDNDEKVGTIALWYAPRGASRDGGRKLEAPYVAGRRHGVTRSWHDNGRPRAELAYEHGELVSARAWRRNGTEMGPRDAAALAERDAAADETAFAAIESIVTSHMPTCGSTTPTGLLTLPRQLG